MPTIPELQRAIQISEQIQKLEAELQGILNWVSSGKSSGPSLKRGGPRKVQGAASIDELSPGAAEVKVKRKKRKMSAEGRQKIAAAQRARWAKQKSSTGPATAVAWSEPKAKKKKRKLSPEARARIVAAVKARWAKAKKAKA